MSIFRQNSVWYRDLDRYIPEDLKDRLCKLASLSKEKVVSLTLEPLIDNLALYPKNNPHKKWYFVLPIGLKGFVKTGGAYFCPYCLQDDKTAYLRREWKLAWNVACPLHKKLLILRCQKCDTIFSPHKLSYLEPYIYLCSSCGADLRDSPTKDTNDEVLLFQKALNHMAFHNIDSPFQLTTQNRQDFFATLHIFLAFFAKANKYNYHPSLLRFLALPSYAIMTKNNATFNRMTVRDREYLLFACSKIFQYSLHEIIQLFKEFNISKHRFLFTYRNLSPTIESLVQHLHDSPMLGKKKKNPNLSTTSRAISPKAPSQVDKLFKEIEQFL